jgi:putative transposase
VIPGLTTDWILSQFSQEQKIASIRYQALVHSGIKAGSPLKVVKGQLFIGQENFIEEIKHLLRGKERLKEITREERYLTRPALKEIFKDKDQKSKDQARYEAHLQYGYTLKDIAEYIGVHYSTVSGAIKKVEGEDEK